MVYHRRGRDNVQRSLSYMPGRPCSTATSRPVGDLEDDFKHYTSVYMEVAGQYKDMDTAPDVLHRNLLARHLREVVDILEQKGDQIASLYELVLCNDKSTRTSVLPSARGPEPQSIVV